MTIEIASCIIQSRPLVPWEIPQSAQVANISGPNSMIHPFLPGVDDENR